MFLTEKLTPKILLSKRFQLAHYSLILGTVLFMMSYLVWRVSLVAQGSSTNFYNDTFILNWYSIYYVEMMSIGFWSLFHLFWWYGLVVFSSLIIIILYGKENKFHQWQETFLSTIPLFLFMVAVLAILFTLMFFLGVVLAKLTL